MNLTELLRPKTIAVVGASEKLGFGNSTCLNLMKSEIREHVYFVNPKRESLMGKKCYNSLNEITEKIDLVIICTPKKTVLNILKQAAAINCKAAVVYASGYSETNTIEGKKAEKEIVDLCKDLGIALMGPNCSGFINFIDGVFAFGMDINKIDRKGSIGLISQSGQICLTMMDMKHMNFSYAISSGNSSVVSMEDYLEFLVHDLSTKVISLYLEGVTQPKRFISALRKAALKRKPIIVLKTGRSAKGSQIAASHTGSLSGSDKVFDAIFKKFGVIRVNDLEELISTSLLFSVLNKIPDKAAFASMNLSGGETGICADVGSLAGINYPDFTQKTVQKLKNIMPSYATPNNPLDTTATFSYDADGYANLLKIVMDDPNIGMVLCGFTVLPKIEDPCILHMTEGIEKAMKSKNAKPMAMISFSECSRNDEIRKRLENVGVPLLPSTLYSFNIIKYLSDFINYNNKKRTLQLALPEENDHTEVNALSEFESKKILKKYKIPVSNERLANSKKDLKEIEKELDYPIVAKICSPDILHKSDIGGVKLNIQNYEDLTEAYDEILKNAKKYMPHAKIEGVLIQEMLPKGVEVIIGVHSDPQFGPMVMCGLGGVFVELFKDVSLYPTPINKFEAEEMIKSLKAYPLFTGYRGQKKLDIEALADIIVKISNFAYEEKDKLKEMDINPLFIYEEGKGVGAADAVIVMKK